VKNVVLEYVWLDGFQPQNLRSKVKVIEGWSGHPDSTPVWNFDGSSTCQAVGNDSECLLQPVRKYEYGLHPHYLVLCEVMNADGTPHETNTRAQLRRDVSQHTVEPEFWWGFEQEYFITSAGRPLGFPPIGMPDPQGRYYCGVGGNQVRGRALVETHLQKCLNMGIKLTGTNAEVAIGQWEYQCFAKDTLQACDDLWMSRYVLHRMAEQFDCDIDLSPKPVAGDWNGSGCHTNFSNKHMREVGGEKYFANLLESLKTRHALHIAGYGENNDQRLTGEHETQHIETFSWGVADRGASIRVPNVTANHGWKGYVEDRRPAANCDPYKVAMLIVETVLDA